MSKLEKRPLQQSSSLQVAHQFSGVGRPQDDFDAWAIAVKRQMINCLQKKSR